LDLEVDEATPAVSSDIPERVLVMVCEVGTCVLVSSDEIIVILGNRTEDRRGVAALVMTNFLCEDGWDNMLGCCDFLGLKVDKDVLVVFSNVLECVLVLVGERSVCVVDERALVDDILATGDELELAEVEITGVGSNVGLEAD
jgi:hypothetical protein